MYGSSIVEFVDIISYNMIIGKDHQSVNNHCIAVNNHCIASNFVGSKCS